MYRSLLFFCLMLNIPHSTAIEKTEDFSNSLWQHHEQLGTQVSTDDLVFSVPAGGDMRGVTKPNRALYPGFNPAMKTAKVTITSLAGEPFNFRGIELTDLFKMPIENVRIDGYRQGVVDTTDSIGPLWNSLSKSGMAFSFSDFDNVERIEISSNTPDISNSDVFLFVENVTYELSSTSSETSPPTKEKSTEAVPSSEPSSSAFNHATALACLLLIIWHRRRRI